MISLLKRYFACRRLERITRARANSYEIISYRKHRAAALKGIERRKADSGGLAVRG